MSDADLCENIVRAVRALVTARTSQDFSLALARVVAAGQALEAHRR